jgi:hypothetical protein
MAGPFDWMEPKRNAAAARAQQPRREAMYRVELEERAALLLRLGHDKERVRQRLQANLAWDFERGQSPLSAAQVDGIVDKVFAGAGSARPAGRTTTRGGGTR